MSNMSKKPAFQWTHATVAVLWAVSRGHRYGFDIMEATGLPSGTVYPALRRLGRRRLLRSDWEENEVAREARRPRRKYYELTASGEAALVEASKRFPMFSGALAASPETSK